MSKYDDFKKHTTKDEKAAPAAAPPAPAAPVVDADADVKMSPVNPRKPLDKEPTYAPGVGPALGVTGDVGVHTHSDPRVPPENVSVAGVAPGGKATPVAPPEPVVEAVKAAEPTPVITPAQAGLSQPHLRPGLDPLPEEDPTPSTVPIPPPGPRRVA